MAGILVGVGAMLMGKALVTPYEKGRDYDRTVRQIWNDLENLNIALENIQQHELKGPALAFRHKAEKQYARSVDIMERFYPSSLSKSRLVGYSIENGRYKHLLDIGVEANQTTRTLNDILGEERWKKIMSKGEAVKDKLDANNTALDSLQKALDRLRDDISTLKTARDVDEADVAMQRLLKSSRRALAIQRRAPATGPLAVKQQPQRRLIENLNDAFEYLLSSDSNRDKKRAIKYLGGVIQDVEGALNNPMKAGGAGVGQSTSPSRTSSRTPSPEVQRATIRNLAAHVEDIPVEFKKKKMGHDPVMTSGIRRSVVV